MLQKTVNSVDTYRKWAAAKAVITKIVLGMAVAVDRRVIHDGRLLHAPSTAYISRDNVWIAVKLTFGHCEPGTLDDIDEAFKFVCILSPSHHVVAKCRVVQSKPSARVVAVIGNNPSVCCVHMIPLEQAITD